ncbi:RHS repeat-associated core domain-containing protein [Burkholderia contaminans]|uniref:RHS repeat-associated core domain-containing protein n=1 Tax=Burkholderia sp. HI4860 TaxID=2015361 RepID=UPI0028F455DF|nr:RHS repeat-associated core domain-containing protein [Burkholderia contaminans]
MIARASKAAGIVARNSLRFQGQQADEESGLAYNRYRYYDPNSGRFVSKDPIGLAGGINVYQYAPNPVSWIDPLGLARCPCADDCEKILADEGVVTGRHGDLKKIDGLQDSHHIYQDAAVNKLPDYNYNAAPAISLQGRNEDGTTRGTPHYMANRTQDNASAAGTLGSETVVAYNSLKAAGLSPKAAKCAVLKARSYFSGIGASAGSRTVTPSKRG